MKAAIDTHSFVKRLIGKGFKESQAEEMVGIVNETRNFDLNDIVSKHDLFELKATLKNDIQEVKKEIAERKYDIIKLLLPLLITIMLGILGLFGVLFKYLVNLN